MRRVQLRPLDEQVIVLTGATSGLGLVTARMACDRGAKLVLAARSHEALHELAEELRADGCSCEAVVADVGDFSEVRKIAAKALEVFGHFDSWVNNAAVSTYGRLDEVSLEDQRRLFDTVYWGTVHGSLVALDHLRARGGAIINVASVLSDTGFPLQGPYVAAKHAVKGFTDSLRMEQLARGAPVSITLLKPAAIHTPYPEHAKSYLAMAPQNPPPLYAPEIVARAILHCCQHPVRERYVGGAGALQGWLGRLAPALRERGNPSRSAREHSFYTEAWLAPLRSVMWGTFVVAGFYTLRRLGASRVFAALATLAAKRPSKPSARPPHLGGITNATGRMGGASAYIQR